MKNHSLSIKFFITFSILLIVVTIIYIVVYDHAVLNSTEREIGKNCIVRLKMAEMSVLEFKSTIHKDAIRLSANSKINALSEVNIYKSDDRQTFQIADLMKLSDALDIILEAFNTNIRYESIYLYLKDLGYSITSNQGFVSNVDLKDTQWLKYYNDYTNRGLALGWIDTRLPYGSNSFIDYYTPNSIITYIYPLTPYTTALQGALVVNIREEVLSKLINANNINREEYVFVINNKGDVISHLDKSYLCTNVSHVGYINSIISSDLDEGYIKDEVNSNKSLVSYYKSQNNDWIYIGVFSLEPLISSVNGIRTNTIYLSILVAILSIIGIYLITRKLCSPVKELIQEIRFNKGINILEDRDEMIILRKAFKSLSNELEKNQRKIAQNQLINLLEGKSMYQSIDDQIIGQFDFQYEHFICASILIDKYDEFLKKFEVDRQYYLKMLIINISEQVINSFYKCVGVNMDRGEIGLIINVSSWQIPKLQVVLQECFQKIQNETAKIFDYTISVGLGKCHKGDDSISISYIEASQALKLRIIYGYGSIIMWSNDFGKHKYYYPTTIEKYILNQIETGDISTVEETVKELVEKIKNKIGISSDNVVQIFNQLVGNTVIKYLADINIDISQIFGSNFNIYNELSKKETMNDIEQWLINIYRRMLEYIRWNMGDDKVGKIVDYIEKNYKKDIGITDIADYLGFSYSHVRKIFKDKTGRNIVDFINSLRITEAKNLLTNSDLCIKELALLVGYNNDQTFTRIFKKLEGVTPGEYRVKTK
ncbi:MAG: AraC family transcriptional regulator [Clostridiales bacterium]|nr:AraC family transcriptional regulator [Clostridiales bacterium]